MSTQSVIETLVERAEKFDILIRNEERSTLPSTQNLLISCLKDMRPLGLSQATIKELPPATSPKLICASMLNHTGGRIGKMLADKAGIVSIPKRREDPSDFCSHEVQILGGWRGWR
jgi:hypothetical protein